MTRVDSKGKTTEERLEARLKGYTRTSRGIFLSLRSKAINPSEFTLWLFSAMVLADWDDKHSSIYGTFDFSFEAIAKFFCVSRSTICKQAKRLFELGYWVRRPNDSRIWVVGFEQFSRLGELTLQQGIVSLDDIVALGQQNDSNEQQSVENIQPQPSKANPELSHKPVEKNHRSSSKLYGSSKGEHLDDEQWLIRGHTITTGEPFTIDIRKVDMFIEESRHERSGVYDATEQYPELPQ